MNRHSTLASYLEKLVWLLTGNFAKPGAQYAPTATGGAGPRRRRPGQGRQGGAASPVAGARIIGGLVPVQRDRRGDPHRSPGPLPGHDRRERQPGALAGRQQPDARGARRARPGRRHRRRHDRDRPPRRLRAAGAVAVREVGGDVLQLRLPAQRLPPAPAAPVGAGGGPARARDPRPARRGARSRHRGRPRAAAGGRRRGTGAFAEAFFAATAANPTLGAARPGRALPDARTDPAGRRRVGRHPLGCGPPLRHVVPRLGAPGRLRRRGVRAGRAAVRRHPGQPVRRGVHGATSTRTAGAGSRTEDGRFHLAIPELLDELATLRRAARRPTPTTRSSSRPASGGRSRPTRSSATRRGASRTPAARCACTRPTRRASASPTAGGPA